MPTSSSGGASRAPTPAPAGSQTRPKRSNATSTTATSLLSSADAFEAATDEIKNAEKAHEVLAGRFLVPPNMPPAVDHLLAAMLTLARSKPGAAVAVQSLVALYHYAKAAFETELAKGVADVVAKKLNTQVDTAIKAATADARRQMEGMVKDMQGQVNETRQSMGEAVAGASRLLDEVRGVVVDGAVGPILTGSSGLGSGVAVAAVCPRGDAGAASREAAAGGWNHSDGRGAAHAVGPSGQGTHGAAHDARHARPYAARRH
ncbi:hypothetical protein L226DRAFT_562222 [Lentinus tigrinus ALCF2SS1-7]|uniref:uncharacterized protein n=1 Tax=Lentinus tigrinus ALCF2SS1-7 TaxID=1328758 RepID=UPI0011663E33|nr:hypothetical protein L226DRAFT_562222 [Lentinus tigrinus ALCF2SS1-7]